jgi:hypothetical protein
MSGYYGHGCAYTCVQFYICYRSVVLAMIEHVETSHGLCRHHGRKRGRDPGGGPPDRLYSPRRTCAPPLIPRSRRIEERIIKKTNQKCQPASLSHTAPDPTEIHFSDQYVQPESALARRVVVRSCINPSFNRPLGVFSASIFWALSWYA